jgi:hypothetical protein
MLYRVINCATFICMIPPGRIFMSFWRLHPSQVLKWRSNARTATESTRARLSARFKAPAPSASLSPSTSPTASRNSTVQQAHHARGRSHRGSHRCPMAPSLPSPGTHDCWN